MTKIKRLGLILVRLAAFAATLSATIVMATSHEKASFLTISFEAKYSQTPAFKYFMIANAIVSVYGFLVIFLPAKSLLWRLVIAMDLVFAMLLSSSISAALAIAYVGKKGNTYAGWLPICGQVQNYCDHVKGALVAGFIGVIIYFLLLMHAMHTILDPLLLKKT
ncbi:CASP-like protein 1C1 [Humulus lupulus]|uniref:CASP-like protein 1C1 n=1 Tax=Humulus lupulus TaxID=3486 RepID=UPI002B40FFA5|nr:CASP-like protein 1C1 [Humulus lupulus]